MNETNQKFLEELLKKGSKVNQFRRYEYKIEHHLEFDVISVGIENEPWEETLETMQDRFYETLFEDELPEVGMEDIKITSIIDGFYDEVGKEYILNIEKRGDV